MGAGASVSGRATQEQLDQGVATLTALKWDRAHIRVRAAECDEEIDGRVMFQVISDSAYDGEVDHPLISKADNPTICSFVAPRGKSLVFNETNLLLYQRSREKPEPNRSELSGRKLRIRLDDVKTLKEKMDEKIANAGDALESLGNQITTFFQSQSQALLATAPDVEATPVTADAEAPPASVDIKSDAAVLIDLHEIAMPAPEDGWTDMTLKGSKSKIHFSIRTSLAEDVLCSTADIQAMEAKMDKIVLTVGGDQKALLRSLQKPADENGVKNMNALLWIPGFNDSFHNTIAAEAFMQAGWDVWILDLRRCGACRREFVPVSAAAAVEDGVENGAEDGAATATAAQQSPMEYHSIADFAAYHEEINQALDVIGQHNPTYKKIVGYSYNIGSLAFNHFLMNSTRGEAAFAGFIYNSPFLSWGYVGGQLTEQLKREYAPAKAIADAIDVLGVQDLVCSQTPSIDAKSGKVDNPSLVIEGISAWQMKIRSLYEFDLRTQTLYNLTLTPEWNQAVTKISKSIENLDPHRNERITSLPVLVIDSKHDRSQSSALMQQLVPRLGPATAVILLQYAQDDVLASFDREKTTEALEYVLSWLKANV